MSNGTNDGHKPDRPDGPPGDQERKRSGRRRSRRPRRRGRRDAGASGTGSGEQNRRGKQSRGGRRPEAPTGPAPDEDLVVVQFKGHRKGYYHNRQGVPLVVGDYCLVEADRGRDLGRVNYVGRGSALWWDQARRQGVLGAASAADLKRLHENRGDEWGFWDIAQEKIQGRRLKMNLVTIERRFDHKKITFYFTAEQRVDFRELVRDLASVFRTRIELRQIGVRDEARLKGGMGICGREFCCSTFLHAFLPVTLKMAKNQQLPMNPGKLSGPCGRLRCCVTYEHEVYQELRRRLPRVGTEVSTSQGRGRVRKLDLMRETVTVDVPGLENYLVLPATELKWRPEADLPAPRDRRPDTRDDQGGHGGGRKPRGNGA
ncbi:MAG: stage 0 sporulation family protein [bacterium]|nr:stage 0 sporulation family protein [bacterium]